ncbi:hypothetical protein EVG20_g5393 [Dentipellis fragilis]|uniref:DUF6533 domain-containing protein n=1 Tax=Dentipellis fragilis TaxID=205917 RepID=A0A4Y9YU41_9AGAM|nr:hypothetical protein EVG20_g5393 [Dentipellis fragilis]
MDPASIVTALEEMRVVTLAHSDSKSNDSDTVCAFSLLVYDYSLTFSSEVETMWGADWSTTKIVYLLVRYVPFVDISTNLYANLGLSPSDALCHPLYSATICARTGMMVFAFTVAKLVLILRTWAIWRKNNFVRYGLGVLLVAACSVMCYCVQKLLESMEFAPIAIMPPQVRGCFITHAASLWTYVYTIILVYETIRTSNSVLIVSLYRDGILAYVPIFLSSVANVLISVVGPLGYRNLLVVTSQVVHVTAITRILLNIRRNATTTVSVSNYGETDFGTISEFTFAPRR